MHACMHACGVRNSAFECFYACMHACDMHKRTGRVAPVAVRRWCSSVYILETSYCCCCAMRHAHTHVLIWVAAPCYCCFCLCCAVRALLCMRTSCSSSSSNSRITVGSDHDEMCPAGVTGALFACFVCLPQSNERSALLLLPLLHVCVCVFTTVLR